MAENTTTKVDIPHFSLPLRYVGGRPAVNEQDSWDDVYDSAQAIARYARGFRDDMPDFGITPLEFTIDTELARTQLESEIEEWEPRVNLHVEWESALADMSAQAVVKVEDPSA